MAGPVVAIPARATQPGPSLQAVPPSLPPLNRPNLVSLPLRVQQAPPLLQAVPLPLRPLVSTPVLAVAPALVQQTQQLPPLQQLPFTPSALLPRASFVSTTTGTSSFSVTVTAGVDRLLVVAVSGTASVGARTVTYGGVTLSVATTSDGFVQLFYLLAPTVGTATLTVSGASIGLTIAAQYTGIFSFQSATQGTAESFSVSPTAGGLIVCCVDFVGASATPLAGTVERVDDNIGDWYGDSIVTAAGTLTVGANPVTSPDGAAAIFLDSGSRPIMLVELPRRLQQALPLSQLPSTPWVQQPVPIANLVELPRRAQQAPPERQRVFSPALFVAPPPLVSNLVSLPLRALQAMPLRQLPFTPWVTTVSPAPVGTGHHHGSAIVSGAAGTSVVSEPYAHATAERAKGTVTED